MLLNENLFDEVKEKSIDEKFDDEMVERKHKISSDYKKYAGLEENASINKDGMDDWAVRRTCRVNNCSEEQLMDSLEEDLNNRGKKYIAFNHFDPEELYFVTDDSKFDYSADVTAMHGQVMVSNNDEEIYVTEHPESLKEIDLLIYDDMTEFFNDPDEDTYYEENYLYGWSMDRDEFEETSREEFSAYTDFITDSYVDGDSNYQYQLINLDKIKFQDPNDYDENLEEDLNDQMIDQTIADAAKAAQEIENELIVKHKGQIESALDEALEQTLDQKELGRKSWSNILLIGEAGTGKSSIVRQWAKDNNINLFEVRAAGMDDTDLGGAITRGEGEQSGVMIRLASTEFDKLDRPNSVLFLDEYNRAPKSVRTNLLELINSHIVPDPRSESGQRYLENFLFTVAAINPATSLYDTDTLDMAERTRFRNIDIVGEPKTLLNYLTKTYQEAADKASNEDRKKKWLGRLNLAKALLTSKDFFFDTQADIEKSIDEGNGLSLNYRTLTNALEGSNGTKEDFLRKWNEYSNKLKKPMIERILLNYKDIDDKANAALADGTDSEVFKSKSGSSIFSSLIDAIENL